MGLVTSVEEWQLAAVTRGLHVILVADVVESVRLMQADEAGFIQRWRQFVHSVRAQVLPKHGGVLVKSLGDGLLIQFEAAPAAVMAALHMLDLCASQGVQLRVGIHSADVVRDELDIYGVGVNVAARLGALAGPGEIVVSAEVRDALTDGVNARVIDLGDCFLKHIDSAVRAFRVEAAQTPCPRVPRAPQPHDHLLARVAVLPFDDIQSSRRQHAMSAALADALIARLCRVPALQVISRLSTVALAAEADPVAACARFLDAHFIVSGSYHLNAGHARGMTQVTDASTGCVVWSDSFDVGVADLFMDRDAGITRMAQNVCKSMATALVQRARGMPVPNLESFTLYAAGLALMHRLNTRDFTLSHDLLSALCERHPRAAAPLAMLAKWHMLCVLQGWASDPREVGRQGLATSQRALEKDPDHPLALAIAGLMGMHFDHDLQAARARVVQATEADPQEPSAWMTLAGIDSYLERGEQAIAHARRAIALSPLDPCRYLFNLMLGAGQLACGQTAQAIASAEASMRLNAVHAPTYRLAAIANMLAGRYGQAQRAATALLKLDPGFRVSTFVERYPGRDQPHAANYARALKEAGIPP